MNRKPGFADPDNNLVPFGQFHQLHYGRFFIVESATYEDVRAYGLEPKPFPPSLGFMGDVDGEREDFLADVVERAAPGLRRLFEHCEGFGDDTDLLVWMSRRNVPESANYVNWVGRTVVQIKEEDRLRRALREKLPSIIEEIGSDRAAELYDRLKAYGEIELRDGRLTLSEPEPTPLDRRARNLLHLASLPVAVLILWPILLPAAPLYLFRLRQLEKSDPEILPQPDRAPLKAIEEMEDHDVTNPFGGFGEVKPGRFRRLTALTLLWLINYFSRHLFNSGYLARIQTIHFARWVLLEDDTRVMFASNYDGSAESYRDDFINKTAFGLNLIFSNGIGYPRTRWLIKDGAEDEDKFKRFWKRRQLMTDVWYKAYPGLTAFDLAENSRFRAGFERKPRGDRALHDWLNLL